MQHRLQLHGVPIQAAKIAHPAIKLYMQIVDVQLGELSCLTMLRK
jgi:hypothetical protein